MGSRRDCTWILGLAGFRVVTADSHSTASDGPLTIRIERRGTGDASSGIVLKGWARAPVGVRTARDGRKGTRHGGPCRVPVRVSVIRTR